MTEAETRWPPALRVAFRFAVCFFAITTPYLAIGHLSAVIPFSKPFLEAISYRGLFAAYQWGTTQLFGSGVVYNTIAGFKAYMSTALIGAGAVTVVWSLIDRRSLSYPRLHAGLRVYLRYLLAAVAISYGAMKAIPIQFAPPSLVALITPLGELTRMRLLWHFMGTSTAYIVFTGLVEVTGGLLLLSRRTTPLGALVLAAAFTNVAILNFGYEVGVQLNSTIYVLMALTLLAPDARRLATAFLASSRKPGRIQPGWHRLGGVVMTLLAAAFIVVRFREANRDRRTLFTIPALYGMYDVEEFTRDSVAVPTGDSTRWLRLVIAERGTAAIQWTVGGRVDPYSLKEDPKESVLTLTGRGSKPAVHTLRFVRETDDRLAVVGTVDGHLVQARLRAMDLTKFPLRRPRR